MLSLLLFAREMQTSNFYSLVVRGGSSSNINTGGDSEFCVLSNTTSTRMFLIVTRLRAGQLRD
jgi:hypothetical protein